MNKIKLASEPMTNIDKVAIGISYLKSLLSILTDGFDILHDIGDENAKKEQLVVLENLCYLSKDIACNTDEWLTEAIKEIDYEPNKTCVSALANQRNDN